MILSQWKAEAKIGKPTIVKTTRMRNQTAEKKKGKDSQNISKCPKGKKTGKAREPKPLSLLCKPTLKI